MEDLVGVVFKSISVNDYMNEIIFVTDNDVEFKMYHSQDCCERVSIEDICGDMKDLIGSPIIVSEETISAGLLMSEGGGMWMMM